MRHFKAEGALLEVEPGPEDVASKRPNIDELTRKMAAALRKATVTGQARGYRTCECGASRYDKTYRLADLVDGVETFTNSLAVHYVAYHRGQLPKSEIALVKTLPDEKAQPTQEELGFPNPRR